jgi:hypothetical protein
VGRRSAREAVVLLILPNRGCVGQQLASLPGGTRVTGRKAHVEVNPEAVALAKKLRRANPKTGQRMSLRKIAAELAAAGHLNERGQPLNPNSVKTTHELLRHGSSRRGRRWRRGDFTRVDKPNECEHQDDGSYDDHDSVLVHQSLLADW